MWTNGEEDKLKELYPIMRNEELAYKLGKTISSIENKGFRLGLKKSPLFKGQLITERNKIIGRDLTYELLREIALKYKTRSEFQLSDPSAYTTARVKGILSEICEHMLEVSFSIPQLILRDIMDELLGLKGEYNTRKVIPPYEIDLYYPTLKLGFEYQGKGWHINNINDSIKLTILRNEKINIIYIVENTRVYEEDIKNQIINHLPIINDLSSKQITNDKVLKYKIKNPYLSIYNKEDLIKITKSYTSFKIFKKSEPNVYYKLSKMKLLDEATLHMGDKLRKRDIKEVNNVIKKYEYIGDLIKNDYSTYIFIKRNKLEKLITHLKYKRNRN